MSYEEVHKSTSGPGDARPTALKIVEDQKLIGKLAGKTILITGASSGIGAETARALHATGARIFVTARSSAKGQQVAESIKSSGGLPVEVIEMELDSFDSIRSGVSDFLAESKSLNVLICNAGVMACPESKTREGFEMQFGVNYMSHFLLFQLLKDTLLDSSTAEFASRVVMVSSSGHRGGGIHVGDYNFEKESYNAWAAYSQSKTADIYLANEIERRFGSKGLHGLSLNPGWIHTPLERHAINDSQGNQVINNPAAAHIWKSPEQGAATSVWAATASELEGKGGIFLEDVAEAKPYDDETAWDPMYAEGYAPHAFDHGAAEKLWEDSLAFVAAKSK